MTKQLLRRAGSLAVLALSAVGLVSCGNDSADIEPADAVNVRIQNETGLKIDRLWLGAGPEAGSTFLTRYVDIEPGAVTDYQTIEPVIDNYRKADFQVDGQRYIAHDLDPHVVLGVDSLSAGSFYTFVLTLPGGSDPALSEVTVDTP